MKNERVNTVKYYKTSNKAHSKALIKDFCLVMNPCLGTKYKSVNDLVGSLKCFFESSSMTTSVKNLKLTLCFLFPS